MDKMLEWIDYRVLKDYIPNLPRPDCLHRGCTECGGTGRKKDGTFCVHMLSCPCPNCSPARL